MSSNQKYCHGVSRVLALLFIVVGMHSVGVHQVEAVTLLNGASVKTSVENALNYVVAPSPVSNNGANTVMTLTFDKETGIQVCAGMVSTFASWPVSGYDWDIQPGVEIPVSACKTSDFSDGTYRTFVCLTNPSYNCSGQDWGGSSYPTYGQANSISLPYYVDFTVGAGGLVVGGVPEGFTTRLIDATATGTASTTIFNVDYFLETSEFNTLNRPDTLTVVVATEGATQLAEKKSLILPLLQGNASKTLEINGDLDGDPLPDGDYTAWFRFFNFTNGTYTFTKTSLTLNFSIVAGLVTDVELVDASDGIDGTIGSNPYVDVPCGITAIGGCIQNAFAFLFIPSQNGMQQITNLYDTLSTKFPFAYFTDFNDSITSVFTNPTTESLAISVPFGTFGTLDLISEEMIEDVPFTSLIRELLGALIWLMMAYTIYRRTLRIFNKETT